MDYCTKKSKVTRQSVLAVYSSSELKTNVIHIPMQDFPFASNLNPVRHSHRYDPKLFTHSCWHSLIGDLHSSMSEK